jgi:hypothetical protein
MSISCGKFSMEARHLFGFGSEAITSDWPVFSNSENCPLSTASWSLYTYLPALLARSTQQAAMVVLETMVTAAVVKSGAEAAGVLVAGITAYRVRASRKNKQKAAEEAKEQEEREKAEALSIDTPVDTGLSDDIESWLPGQIRNNVL